MLAAALPLAQARRSSASGSRTAGTRSASRSATPSAPTTSRTRTTTRPAACLGDSFAAVPIVTAVRIYDVGAVRPSGDLDISLVLDQQYANDVLPAACGTNLVLAFDERTQIVGRKYGTDDRRGRQGLARGYTSAVALAASWPRRALVAECDPHGGELVYRMVADTAGRSTRTAACSPSRSPRAAVSRRTRCPDTSSGSPAASRPSSAWAPPSRPARSPDTGRNWAASTTTPRSRTAQTSSPTAAGSAPTRLRWS